MALIGSGSVLLVSEAWGEPDPVNGEEEGNQGNRQTRGCTPIRGLGIDTQAYYSLPKAFGKEPFEVGPAATVTHCRWDSQLSSPRFRPHLGLSLGFLPLCFISVFSSCPSFPTTLRDERRIWVYWPYGN